MDVAAIWKQKCPGLMVSTEAPILESHGQDWTRFTTPAPAAVVFPDSSEQVCALVQVAAGAGLALVPSGGRTGLSGGAVAAHGETVVSFDRMRKVLDFNSIDRSVTVEAGVVTATVQALARQNGLYYPVSFASEGSSQIGGNIATNAGGIRVLKYGLTRDRVAGLKVVTGRGELLDLNRGLVKNASGYDLRHLFIASEGTLGLIVEATLNLASPPLPSKVLLLGLESMDSLMKVFDSLRASLELSAFEFFTDRALHHVCRANALPAPFDTTCPLYVITEFDCPDEQAEETVMERFEYCSEQGWLLDGVISQNERQIRELWRYREGISESISHFPPYKNDLSVRVSAVPEFLQRLDGLMQKICPDFEVVWYGHIGDGNLHMNILKPVDLSLDDFESRSHEISERTYALTEQIGGSISAEHGIGMLKQPWLGRTRSGAEIKFMQQIKAVFDPAGIFNPGKLLP
ncbi:MAG: FAD-binding oxidoreductase [Xanthomonadales bacterium]|nr:FAD-binding oxidoreductase [Gammaproteobacteria bacterium]NND58487.1 FAD-binding oxidoreductase [Xanthomonadales bacterium]